MRRTATLLGALLLGGCAVQLTPPPPPEVPRALFLLDHGRHTSLLLERPDGRLLRYAYGDWRYYAEGQTGVGDGLRALTTPTPAALGRRLLPGPADPQQIPAQVAVAIERLIPLCAEAPAIDQLLAELEQIYQAGLARRIVRHDYDLEFVPHPLPYTFEHNSNYMVGVWLQQLGSEVHGHPRLANWRLVGGSEEGPLPCLRNRGQGAEDRGQKGRDP